MLVGPAHPLWRTRARHAGRALVTTVRRNPLLEKYPPLQVGELRWGWGVVS